MCAVARVTPSYSTCSPTSSVALMNSTNRVMIPLRFKDSVGFMLSLDTMNGAPLKALVISKLHTGQVGLYTISKPTAVRKFSRATVEVTRSALSLVVSSKLTLWLIDFKPTSE